MNRTIGMLFALFGDTASTRSGTKTIENIGTKWIGAMLQLAQGFLPVELVPYQQMKHCIRAVGSSLRKYTEKFSVIHQDVAYYYQMRDIRYTQTNTSVIITVPIPLS